MPVPPPSTSPLSAKQLLPLLVILVMVAFANLLPHFQVAEAAGADSSGYLNEARLVGRRTLEVPQPAIPGVAAGQLADTAFIPLGFRPAGAGRMVPTYPIGLPLLIAITPRLPGWDNSAGPIICLHALVGLLLMYVLGRQVGLSPWGSCLALLVLAASPLFVFTAEQPLSDVPALTWCAAAVACALATRRSAAWSVAAGAAVSVAAAVRPTDVLVLVPVAIALGTRPANWAGLALGALPGMAALGIVQHALYGSAFSTGYGNVGPLFSWSFLPPTLAEYAWALPVLLTPLVLLVAALPWVGREAGPRPVAMLLGWIGVFTGFYAFYYCTHEAWWYLRFLLPAFPPLILGSLVAGEALLRRRGTGLSAPAALLAGLAVLVWGGAGDALFRVFSIPRFDATYPAAVRWMIRRLPPKAVVAAMQASGSLYHESTFPLLRYDQLAGSPPATFAILTGTLAKEGRPLYALLAPFEVRPALERAMPGTWSLTEVLGDWTVWHFDGLQPEPIADPAPREVSHVVTPAGEFEALVGNSWYGIETGPDSRLRIWSRGDSTVEVIATPASTRPLKLRLVLDSKVPVPVRITQDGRELWAATVERPARELTIPFTIRDGRATLRFFTDAPGVPEPAARGGRQLKFAIYDPQLLTD